MTTIILTTEQVQTLTFMPQTALGKPSQIQAGSLKTELVEGSATAEVLSDSQVKFISEDDLGANLTATTKFLVKGDADLGDGVVEISEEVVVIVTVPQAAGFGVELGAVEAK